MNEQEMIASYEKILDVTGLMLEAARGGDWDRLTELEGHCRAEVDRLREVGDSVRPLPEPLRMRKTQIIRRVLADDAEIRRITEPWMTQLEQMIGNLGNQRKLAGSYGAQPPS